MKTVPAPLQAILDGTCMHIAVLVEIARTDGVTLRFADTDEPVPINGDTFLPGLVPGELNQKASLSPPNQSTEIRIDSVLVTREDLESGRFDNAEIKAWLCAFDSPASGRMAGLRGSIGAVTVTDIEGQAEIRGLADRMRQVVSEVFSIPCIYDLGDSRCRFDLPSLTVTGSVTTVVSQREFTSTALSAQADDYFQFGPLTWTTGLNTGRKNQVKTHVQGAGVGEIVLAFSEALALQVGDQFSIAPGCAKDLTACRDKFDNVVNHGGFPYIPGQNQILKTGGQ